MTGLNNCHLENCTQPQEINLLMIIANINLISKWVMVFALVAKWLRPSTINLTGINQI